MAAVYNGNGCFQLGDKMIREMDPTKRQYVLTKTGPQKPLIPPKLTQPLVHYAELPGGWHYMYCRKPGPMPKCCGDECTCIRCECGTEITTGSTDRKVDRSQKHFRLWLNQQFKVEGFECLSRKVTVQWVGFQILYCIVNYYCKFVEIFSLEFIKYFRCPRVFTTQSGREIRQRGDSVSIQFLRAAVDGCLMYGPLERFQA